MSCVVLYLYSLLFLFHLRNILLPELDIIGLRGVWPNNNICKPDFRPLKSMGRRHTFRTTGFTPGNQIWLELQFPLLFKATKGRYIPLVLVHSTAFNHRYMFSINNYSESHKLTPSSTQHICARELLGLS